MKHIVLDTNILLLDANNLIGIGSEEDVTIVLPETVLEEMDSKKSGFSELAYQARSFGRMMSTATDVVVTRGEVDIQTSMVIDGVNVIVIALSKYDIDTSADSKNDQKIIACATHLKEAGNTIELMSNDVLMRLRGLAVGLTVTDFKVNDNEEYKFVKEVLIEDEDVFRGLHYADVYSVDPDYVLENYSYKFISTTGQVKLATVINGFVNVIGKETEKQLRQQMVAPMNSEQMLVSKALQDPAVDLVIIEGKAGSGKNIMALSNAVKLMKLNKDKYESIVYVRSPIDDEDQGEDIGYRSGEDAKMGVYLGPVEDTIDYLVRSNINTKGKKKTEIDEKVEAGVTKLKETCNISSRITTGTRGLTYHNTILWLDEAGNFSPATMQKMLSRVGKNCKVIVTGSQTQIDSKFLTKYNNGLAVLMGEASERAVDTDVNMFAITLEKVVRSSMAGFAEDLFSKQTNK